MWQLLLSEITNDYGTYMEPVKKFCAKPGGEDAYILPNGFYKLEKHGPVSFAGKLSIFLLQNISQNGRNINFVLQQMWHSYVRLRLDEISRREL